MASNNEKEEDVEIKTVQKTYISEEARSATVTQIEKEGVVEAKELMESKSPEEDVTGEPEDKTTTPSKEEMENPEVEVDIPHAPEDTPSEQPAPKPADVAPPQTQQKGCCVIS